MKAMWDKIRTFGSKNFSVVILSCMALVMISGLILQNKIHARDIEALREINNSQLEIYKQEYKDIKAAGDNLYKVYSREKAESDLKEKLIERQQEVIQQLIKRLEEINKWQNIDPDSIT